MKHTIILSILCFLLSNWNLQAQEELIIPFSNTEQAKSLEINIFSANIIIVGSNRKDIKLTYETKKLDDHQEEREIPDKAKGMKRIAAHNFNFELSEKNNAVKIKSENFSDIMYMKLEVPENIDIEIRKEIGENIEITNITGNLNLECNVGSILVKELNGTVSASASTGDIEIEFEQIPDQQTMIFNSITGTIDLLLPASIRADLKLRTEWGEVFSDHDVAISPQKPSLKKSDKHGSMKVVGHDWTIGTINGGGSVNLSCYTKMGSILLRK